ncbi:MAG: hypothetical protein A3H70_04090 [Candidatus Komeilibacteria bacterium RIFCSPLOWO2_02_FULL_48_11]|uniref:Thioredoxin domain-containing protein n=1 Tax=Candidatus Komeilibacteria bacterium RIFCSPLOWO2_02_FULL_48_11 TaxID=1798553 RepID=A0A1G2BQX6_9BACT|nr:MAG: hypothetical protein A3H70_04090 [Candidatus Komeilibacteria bacterium RIFCSPLOWO2_02_FULL_48_11]
MKKVFFIITLAALAVVAVVWQVATGGQPNPELDSFAQCLTDKGVAMYGAKWCLHCQNQKKAFGKSFRLIKYLECPDNIELCLAKDIQGYPTWIINDKKYEGEQSLASLSQISDCPLL